MDIPDWLKSVAPTIASALGGPLAGLAVKVVSEQLGVKPEELQESLTRLDKEQVERLKLAELEIKKLEKSLSLDFAKLENADRAGAREMQIATRSFIPAFLSVFITLGFFGILGVMLHGAVEKSDSLMIMLGSLGTAWTGIISFYFGSSAGSQRKDEMLAKSEPGNNK